MTRERPRSRRRGWIILAAVVVVLLGPPLTITLVNDAAAQGIEAELLALPRPDGADHVGSASRAGKLTGNGNGMQYLGAMFLRSDLGDDELQDFYDQVAGKGRTLTVTTPEDLRRRYGVERSAVRGAERATQVVFAWGEGPGDLFEEFDLRGH